MERFVSEHDEPDEERTLLAERPRRRAPRSLQDAAEATAKRNATPLRDGSQSARGP